MSENSSILLVEDDENDAYFTERALKELGFTGKVQILGEALLAKRYMSGEGEYSDRAEYPFPSIIFADSAVTAKDSGVAFLEWLHKNKIGENIPLVIMSGGVTPELAARAQAAGVSGVISKGPYDQLRSALRLAIEKLPAESRQWLKT